MKKIFYPVLIVTLSLFMFSCKHSDKSSNNPTNDKDPVDTPSTDDEPVSIEEVPPTPTPTPKLTYGSFFKAECQTGAVVSKLGTKDDNLVFLTMNKSDCNAILTDFLRVNWIENATNSVCGAYAHVPGVYVVSNKSLYNILSANPSLSMSDIFKTEFTSTEINKNGASFTVTNCGVMLTRDYVKKSDKTVRELIDERCLSIAQLKIREASKGETIRDSDEYYIYFDPTKLPDDLKDGKCWKGATFEQRKRANDKCVAALRINDMYKFSITYLEKTNLEDVLKTRLTSYGHHRITKCSADKVWTYSE